MRKHAKWKRVPMLLRAYRLALDATYQPAPGMRLVMEFVKEYKERDPAGFMRDWQALESKWLTYLIHRGGGRQVPLPKAEPVVPAEDYSWTGGRDEEKDEEGG